MASEDALGALERLQLDPDIAAENGENVDTFDGFTQEATLAAVAEAEFTRVPLSMGGQGRTHVPNQATADLFLAAGGLEAMRRFTQSFYEKAFQDPTLDQFIRLHSDPHGERFATWIAQKLGGTDDWTQNRQERPRCPFHAPGVGRIEVTDRSSAHFAAWHSPKRDPAVFGEHFKLPECRVWMRLHFWAARESGVFDHKGFENYYVKCIAHFMSVYERTAPQFARESWRWSLDKANCDAYVAAGRAMPDVHGRSLAHALEALAPLERDQAARGWPYAEFEDA